MLKNILGLLLVLCASHLTAQLKLPAVFSDNMVLQRGKPLNIWGQAAAGEKVTVLFASQKKSVTVDTAGKWMLTLDPLKLSSTPADMVVSAATTITLHNILVGDVWLCTGQSNMEYTLDRKLKRYTAPAKGADVSIDALAEIKPDAIRYLYVERVLNKIPELPTKGWVNGNDTIIRYVSAIGYFFAREIYAETKVPIGIISSSWGGTRIEQWTPDWAYNNSTVFKDSVTTANFKIDGMHPGQMYNGMIEPMIPFGIKGVLWYQGESNCMIEDQGTYLEKYKLFTNAYRRIFKDDNIPFYTVQIAPFLYSNRKDPKKHSAELLPKFWEVQAKCMTLPGTEMVVTTDLVDKLTDIHPSYKWIVGHRLALTALAKTYGKKSLEYSGPVYKKSVVKKDAIQLQFSHAGKLASSDGDVLTWFTIAGEDGKFVAATAIIKGNKVIVSAPGVVRPTQVRFAWNETAQPNFINAKGLPAQPFRTNL